MNLKEIRCPHCNKLLFKTIELKEYIEIKCHKCKNIISFKKDIDKLYKK